MCSSCFRAIPVPNTCYKIPVTTKIIDNFRFGGFLPFLASAIVVGTGNIYAGLYYPIGVAVMTLIIGVFLLPETKGRITDDFTETAGADD